MGLMWSTSQVLSAASACVLSAWRRAFIFLWSQNSYRPVLPSGAYRMEIWVSWPHVCVQRRDIALPVCPQSANGAMIPVFDPPSTTTRRGGLWGQVRCKQIQYTLHCMAPRGSQWSYSRGTNHFGSRFACFFLLYFLEAHSSPRRELYPATHHCHHTGLFTFGRLRLIEWGPFWDRTSTGLLSVQLGDHRAERERSTHSGP